MHGHFLRNCFFPLSRANVLLVMVCFLGELLLLLVLLLVLLVLLVLRRSLAEGFDECAFASG